VGRVLDQGQEIVIDLQDGQAQAQGFRPQPGLVRTEEGGGEGHEGGAETLFHKQAGGQEAVKAAGQKAQSLDQALGSLGIGEIDWQHLWDYWSFCPLAALFAFFKARNIENIPRLEKRSRLTAGIPAGRGGPAAVYNDN
jgi:hypothetical protein